MSYTILKNEFDTQFLDIEFYQQMPQMMPWVGSSYGKNYNKVLFVGESHYLPIESLILNDLSQWYNININDLNKDEKDFTNTRHTVKKHHSENGIWKNPGDIMKNNKIYPPEGSTNIYEHFSFYNFFQRPAYTAGEIDITPKDIEIANYVFRKVINILKPSVTIFLSSKAWNQCFKNDIQDIDFEFTPHPSSKWWNRESKRYAYKSNEILTGSQKFDKLVKDKISNIQ